MTVSRPLWRRFVPCVALFPLLLFSSIDVLAQAISTASIRGRVIDESQGAIPGASVTLLNTSTGTRRNTTTDAAGEYTIAALPLTGAYLLTVGLQGFADEEVRNIQFRAGETAVFDVTLKLAGATSEVTVYGTTEGVRSDSPQLGTSLGPVAIDEIPLIGRKMTDLALLNSAVRPARGTGDLFLNNQLFVINGSGRRQSSYTIDGSTADDAFGRQSVFTNVPLLAIQEFSVLTNSFSSEYGRTGGADINVVTKSGTNTVHSEVLGMWRPGAFEEAPPLAPSGTHDVLAQGSADVSAPIVADRSHVFAVIELTRETRDSAITSLLGPGVYEGQYSDANALVNFDEKLSEGHRLAIKGHMERFTDTNPSDVVGGLTLPSAGRSFQRHTYTTQATDTAVFSSSMVHELHLQYQEGDPIFHFDVNSPSTQFVYTGFATVGESRAVDVDNRQVELNDQLTLTRGANSLKIGGGAIYQSQWGANPSLFPLGQFTVKAGVTKPVDQLTISDVTRYTQAVGSSAYSAQSWNLSAYAQDDLAVGRDLTLNLGLRYERQTFTDATKNFMPRFGIAWHPAPRTTVRGGYARYYTEIRPNYASTFDTSGPDGSYVSYTATPGQPGFPTSLSGVPVSFAGAVLPARDITVRAGERGYLSQYFDVSKLRGYPDELVNPRTDAANVGVEHEIGRGWIGSADYVHQHISDIDRTLDLNAPAPFVRTAPGQIQSAAAADATRPIVPVNNGYRRILVLMNAGDAWYDALQLNVRHAFGQRYSAAISYTYSRSINTVEPDGGADPNDSTQIGAAEKAPGLQSQPHRVVVSGSYLLPAQIIVSTVITAASGRPYNVITGVDNNGDGDVSDRPVVNGVVLARDTGRTTPTSDVALAAEREFKLPGHASRVSVRVESLNLFNHANIYAYNGTYGNDPSGQPVASFGQPIGGLASVDPGRSVQLMVRWRY